MVKQRVYEVAKELGIESKEVLHVLQDLGVSGRNHMSTLEESEVALAKRKLGGDQRLTDIRDTDGGSENRGPDANASAPQAASPARDDSPRPIGTGTGAGVASERPRPAVAGGPARGVASPAGAGHRGEIRAIKADAPAAPANRGWTRFDSAGKPVAQQRPPRSEGSIRVSRPAGDRPSDSHVQGEAVSDTVVTPSSIQAPRVDAPAASSDSISAARASSSVQEASPDSGAQGAPVSESGGTDSAGAAPVSGVSPAPRPDGAQGLPSGAPRPQGGYQGGAPRPQGGYQGGAPRPAGGYQQGGGYQGGAPRPAGGYQQGGGGYQGGAPRPAGGYQQGGGGYQGGAPRPQGGYQGGAPRPAGAYQGGAPRPVGPDQVGAPRPVGSDQGDAPRPVGGEQGGPPRPAGGYQGGYQGGAPRPAGGYQGGAPRPAGGYQQGGGGGYQGGAPRPAGGYQQGGGGYQGGAPRPGGFQGGGGGGYQGGAPRPGGFQGGGGGGYQGGAPRPGGFQGGGGGGYQGGAPRPGGFQGGGGGGYQGGAPRPGGFQGGAGGGYQGGAGGVARRPGGPGRLAVPPPPSQVSADKVSSTRFGNKKLDVKRETEADKNKAKRGGRVDAFGGGDDERQNRLRARGKARTRRRGFSEAEFREKKKDRLELPEIISVRELAKRMGVDASHVMRKLISLGQMVTLNQEIDGEIAGLVAQEYGMEVVLLKQQEDAFLVIENETSLPENIITRPPIVTIMGHVDHGKTSLLDAIRETNVTSTEAGGITQHIGAYQVELNGRKITFLDTPGHAAFTAMRARGAQVTDIAILVVAADDGIMPQTVEAINHAKAAGVPVIVAINKCDKPAANPEKVKQELTEYGLVVEAWGGDTVAVNVSALQRTGIEDLLEVILLVADVKDLKADPTVRARGNVVEAELDKGMGPVTTVLVSNGTLHLGDSMIAGIASGKVRAMFNDRGERVEEAGPSTPVRIIGLSEVPAAGDLFNALGDDRLAREVASLRSDRKREEELRQIRRVTLEDLFSQIKDGEVKELKIVLKADVQGSVEAVRQSLEKLTTSEVRVNVIHGGVGSVSESDVMLASASNAIVVGFNIRPDQTAKGIAEREGVDVRLYRVIYDAINEMKAAMEGLLDPDIKESILGRAEVRATFKVPKVGIVAGCYVTSGKITRNAQVRVLRDNGIVHEGKIDSLRRMKDDAREVQEGYECGIGVERFNDIKEGDILEAFIMEKVARHLE